jgi:ribosomal protein S18 acetylase RimI-like enzyme
MQIKSITPADVAAVFELQLKYARCYPGATVLPGELYLSPAFHAGEDVFCAFEDGQLLAYAPVYVQIVDGPSELPHIVWTEIKADPDIANAAPIKDALYPCVLSRAKAITQALPDRALRFTFQYALGETTAVEYVQSRGFDYAESVYSMHRDLSLPISRMTVPEGIRVQHWKMPSEEERRMYVTSRNECFPESPVTLAEWQYLLDSPDWADSTTIAAFDGEELAGCVTVYWVEEENAQSNVQAGHTEYIFVRPQWRGRGLAGAMICEGMIYLKDHGKAQARLEVRAVNETALRLYQKLGFQVISESRFYTKMIETPSH